MNKKRESNSPEESVSWLTVLNEELAALGPADLIYPEEVPHFEDEEVKGMAGPEARKLWTYYCITEEKASRRLLDSKYERKDKEKKEEIYREAIQLKIQAETAKSILWVSLREQFSIWDHTTGIGLREDWQVVTFASRDNFITDVLKGFK